MSTKSLSTEERTDDQPTWRGPFAEFDKFGHPTGQRYIECGGCGIEILTDDREHATHREGCRR